jgi:diadenosine tetraphosphate (Ap4A) HIT family hydrolase
VIAGFARERERIPTYHHHPSTYHQPSRMARWALLGLTVHAAGIVPCCSSGIAAVRSCKSVLGLQKANSGQRLLAAAGTAIGSNRLWSSSSTTAVKARNGDEEAAAKTAAAAAVTLDTGAPTLFDKIVSREIPATVVYEDESVLAFRDINPQAPVHVVLIPKRRDGLTQLSKADARHKDVLGQLLLAAKRVADQEGLDNGFRVVINDGPNGCQSVYHLHLHLLGGRQMKWPPG